MKRKILSLLAAAMMAAVTVVGVSAAQPETAQRPPQITLEERQAAYAMLDSLPENENGYLYNWLTGELTNLDITPRRGYISFVSAGISRSGTLTVHCSGSVSIYEDYEVEMELSLQRSTSSSSGFSTRESWTKTATRIGTTDIEEEADVDSGYYYRTRMQADCVNSYGDTVETLVKNSSTLRVS